MNELALCWGMMRDGELLERMPSDWWQAEPRLGRVANGVANRVERIRAIGNGQVPAVVELAWKVLTEGGAL